MTQQAAADIGSYESQERGTAVRACAGKPEWSHMPLLQVADMMYVLEGPEKPAPGLFALTAQLGHFQASGEYGDALDVLRTGFRYLMGSMEYTFEEACLEVIEVWKFGAEKYERHNWMKGLPWSQVLESAQRHVMALHRGELLDSETNLHHGAHFICNAMMLVHFSEYYPEGNDLPVKWFST